MRATTELGIGITYARQGEINDLSIKGRLGYRLWHGADQPRNGGVELFQSDLGKRRLSGAKKGRCE
jgi:hypothetical protein